MNTRQLPAEIITAKREAETLTRFTLDKIGVRWVVQERMANGMHKHIRSFPDPLNAVEYLFNKLPAIESEV